MSRPRRRRGYILITALAVLGILGVLSYGFQEAMQIYATVASAGHWKEEARYVARAGVAEAQGLLATGGDTRALETAHPIGRGTVTVRVEDVRGKLHLNRAPAAELAALLGVDPATVERGRPVVSVYEAYAAFGLTPDQFARARAHTTVHGDGGLNFDAAPVEVLEALDGVAPSQADAIVRHRVGPDGVPGTADDAPLQSTAELAAVPGLDAATAARLGRRISGEDAWRRILATGRVAAHPGAPRTVRVEAVLHREAAGRWTPVFWIDEAPAS